MSIIETHCLHIQYPGHGTAQLQGMASLELGSAQPGQLYKLNPAGTYSQAYCVQHWPSLLGLDPVEASFEGTPEEV